MFKIVREIIMMVNLKKNKQTHVSTFSHPKTYFRPNVFLAVYFYDQFFFFSCK